MQSNTLTAKVEGSTAVFKLQDNALIVEITCPDKDYQLGAKYTSDCLPNEIKFLFKTPAKLFAKLVKSQPKNMSIDCETQLLIPIIFDDQQIILPLPLQKQELSLQAKCLKLTKDLKIKNQIIERQQKQIATLKSNQRMYDKSSSPEHAKGNQQGSQEYKKLKDKYDQSRKSVTTSMFEINKLETLLEAANLQNAKLQEEIKVMKESTDKIVANVKLEYEKELYKKQVELQLQKKQSAKQIKEKSPQKVESPIANMIGLSLIQAAKNMYTKFQFNWNFKSVFAEAYKFAGKKVKKIDPSSYDHHQIYSYERLPKQGKIQITFKILCYGEDSSDMIFGVMAASRKMQEFSGGRHHKKSVGYWSDNQFKTGTLYVDGVQEIKDKQLFINNGHELHMKIDLNEGKINWVHGKHQYTTGIFPNYKNQQLHVFVALKNENDHISIE